MNRTPYLNQDPSVHIAPSAVVLGDLTLGKNVGIWHNTTVRADIEPAFIGDDSNIQDNCVLHTGRNHPVHIGKMVTVGHGAIIHGCTIDDQVIVGMGAIVMNGAHIGRNCIIGAGAVIPEGKDIPEGSLVMGVPGKIVRQLTEKEFQSIVENAVHYVELGAEQDW